MGFIKWDTRSLDYGSNLHALQVPLERETLIEDLPLSPDSRLDWVTVAYTSVF